MWYGCRFTVVVMLVACMPKAQMEVLQPAEIAVAQHIETVAVVDRSRAKNVGQGVLGVLEGAVTGEAIGADTEGRAGAVQGMAAVLEESPQFGVVLPHKSELDSTLFNKPMTWPEAKAICAAHSCQGIVALEAFDSDGLTSVVKQGQGKEVTFEAMREVTVRSSWRLYDVDNKQVIDERFDEAYTSSVSHQADTEDAARNGLPNDNQLVRDFGFVSGESYARRIAPNYIWVTRSFFGGGNARMKEGKRLARRGQWDQAEVLWREGFRGATDPKLKARAAYNVAVSHEVKGELRKAAGWQQKAADAWSKRSITAYGAVLQGRLADAETLRQTLPEEAR